MSQEEERYLLASADGVGCPDPRINRQMPRIIRFAIETAMRQGEILSLDWKHVDLSRRLAHIPKTKNSEPRTVPLTPAAVALLKGEGEEATPLRRGKVFPTTMSAVQQSWPHVLSRARRNYAADCLHEQREAQDGFLEGLRFHDLRHEATSRLFEHGLDIMEVASITGHKSLQMLKRYTHMRAERLADKLASVPR